MEGQFILLLVDFAYLVFHSKALFIYLGPLFHLMENIPKFRWVFLKLKKKPVEGKPKGSLLVEATMINADLDERELGWPEILEVTA